MRPTVRLAVAVVLALAAGLGASRLASSDRAVPDRAGATRPEPGRRAAPPLSRAVGRKIVTGMNGTFPSGALRARVQRGQVGGVILFGPNVGPGLARAIAALQRAARAGGNP